MEAFHWIVVPISTVLGLSIARVLTGYVNAFKARSKMKFDWLPLLFAGAVLGEGLQFWWALFELSTASHWSLLAFTMLVAMVMTLFTAAALIVPSDTDRDMLVAFERDGRWALIALACFHLVAILANSWLWQVRMLTKDQGLLALLAVLCVVGAMTTKRRIQEIVAVVYVGISVLDTFIASVAAY
ncbi:MAG: hypothetical protein M9924_15380 [Rhizobiaceae bacterium]|nr:hypothetical protein [Rhizobiaceae bacterium]